MLEALLVILSTLVLFVVYRIRRATAFWSKSGVPYESYSSYLHSQFVRFRREDVYRVLEDYNAKYGPVYGTYQGCTPVLRVSTVEGTKDVLTRNFSRAYDRSFGVKTGNKLWDNGLLSLDYARWKTVRHLTGLAFTPAKLKLMLPKMVRNARRVAEKLAQVAASADNSIEPQVYAQGFAIDEIAALAYGLDLDAIEDPQNPFVVHGHGVFAPCLGLTLLTTVPWLLKYVPVNFPPRKVIDFLADFTVAVIDKRRREGPPPSNEVDVLELLLAEQKTNPELTDDLIAAQVFTFFTAGFETSAFTLMYTLYLLAVHPDVQEQAYRDIVENAADPSNITYDEYCKMKLVEACHLETLRLYPSDYVIDRVTLEPCTVAGVRLEAGMIVQVPVPAVQRDARFYSEPHRYWPERFTDDNCQPLWTFGDGPKGCIGRRLALLQLTVALCAILLKVRLVPRPDDGNAKLQELPIRLTEGMPFLPMSKDSLVIRVESRN